MFVDANYYYLFNVTNSTDWMLQLFWWYKLIYQYNLLQFLLFMIAVYILL